MNAELLAKIWDRTERGEGCWLWKSSTDNPGCVNPAHLFIGTHAQNMADMARKGRANRPIGELNGRAVLTKVQTAEILEKSAAGISQSALAAMYSVSRGAIYHTLARRTWQ